MYVLVRLGTIDNDYRYGGTVKRIRNACDVAFTPINLWIQWHS